MTPLWYVVAGGEIRVIPASLYHSPGYEPPPLAFVTASVAQALRAVARQLEARTVMS